MQKLLWCNHRWANSLKGFLRKTTFIFGRYVHLQPNRFTCSEPGCDFSTRHKDTLLDHQVDDEQKGNHQRDDISMLDPAHWEEALVLWHLWEGASLAQWTLPLREDTSGVKYLTTQFVLNCFLSILIAFFSHKVEKLLFLRFTLFSGRNLGCISVTNAARSSSRSRSW